MRRSAVLLLAAIVIGVVGGYVTAMLLPRPSGSKPAVIATMADGSRVAVRLPSGRLEAGSLATVTIDVANPSAAPVGQPDLSLSLDDARGQTVVYDTWRPVATRPGGKFSAVCWRCHNARPLAGHHQLQWSFGFRVPAQTGVYKVRVQSFGAGVVVLGAAPSLAFTVVRGS